MSIQATSKMVFNADWFRRCIARGCALLKEKMLRQDIRASLALGGITATMVDMHEQG